MKITTSIYQEFGKQVAEEVLNGYIYRGKTLGEWIDILAQQSCEDCISRKRVLKAIKKLHVYGFATIDEDKLIETINKLPSIMPKKKTESEEK